MINPLKFLYLGFIFYADDLTEAILLGFINLIVIIVTAILLIFSVDYFYNVKHVETLQVVNKKYVSDSYYPVLVGKVTTMQYSPESFNLHFSKVTCSVNETKFNNTNVGEYFTVTYYTGISGNSYCSSTKKFSK